MDYYAPYRKALSRSQMEVNAVWLRNYLQNRGWSFQTDHSGRTFRSPPAVVSDFHSGPRGRKNMVPGVKARGSRFKTTTITRQEDSNRRLNIMIMNVSMGLMEKLPGTIIKGIITNGISGRHPLTHLTRWPLRTIGSMNDQEQEPPDHVRQTL